MLAFDHDLHASAKAAERFTFDGGSVKRVPRSMRAVRDDVTSKLRVAARPTNARAPLVSLPRRVLQGVLLHCPLVDRIAVAQTCHALRKIAFSMPALWSSVSSNVLQRDKRELSMLLPAGDLIPEWRRLPIMFIPSRHHVLWTAQSAILQRSFPRGIRLDVVADFTEQLMELITNHLERTERLRLMLFDWRRYNMWNTARDHGPDPDLYSYADNGVPHDLPFVISNHMPLFLPLRPFLRSISSLNHALSSPAPLLQTLSLEMYQSYPDIHSRADLLSDVFAGQPPPALWRCRLRGINWPRLGCAALSRLTSFDYSPHPGDMTSTELSDILNALPMLETLGLAVQSFKVDTDTHPARHSSLNKVGINIESTRVFHLPQSIARLRLLDGLLAFFLISAPVTLFAIRTDGGGALNPVANSPSKIMLPHRLELAMPWSIAYVEDATYRLSSEVSRLIFNHPEAWAEVLDCSMEMTFTSIFGTQTPAMPALTRLCLVSPHCAQCNLFGTGSAMDAFTARWDCPALQDLHFICRGNPSRTMQPPLRCEGGCFQSLLQLKAFIREHLRFSPGRLRTLSLSGFRRDPEEDPGAALAALYEIAERVDISTSGPLDALVYDFSNASFLRDGISTILDGPLASEWNGSSWDALARERIHA